MCCRSRDDKAKPNANLTDEFSISESEVLTEDDNRETSAPHEVPELCHSQESNDIKHEVSILNWFQFENKLCTY